MRTDLRPLLTTRLAQSDLHVASGVLNRLVTYLTLLERWNEKINLTSLRTPEAMIDRLVVEPLTAVPHLPREGQLIDVGSGGGSPALPLAIATGARRLVMIESRSRKGAFLREAIRELQLDGEVETARFEELTTRPELQGIFDLLTVRALRVDERVLLGLSSFLKPGGSLAWFRTPEAGDALPTPQPLEIHATVQLSPDGRSELALFKKFGDVPRGTSQA